MHQRTVIRSAVHSILLEATSAGENVHNTRILPFRKSELPCIAIYTLEETIDPQSVNTAPRELTRILPIVIEGLVAPGDNVDDAMDALAEEIEDAMHEDPYLTDTVSESVLESTTLEVIEDGDRTMGLVTMVYSAVYRTCLPEEASGLDDLISIKATHNLASEVHEDEHAIDEFAVQEVAS